MAFLTNVCIIIKKLKNKVFDYLIIYLGNTECVYSVKKGNNNFFFWKLKNIFNSKHNYSNLNFLNENLDLKIFSSKEI